MKKVNTGFNLIHFTPIYSIKEKGTNTLYKNNLIVNQPTITTTDRIYNYCTSGIFKDNIRDVKVDGGYVFLRVKQRHSNYLLVGKLKLIEPNLRTNTRVHNYE